MPWKLFRGRKFHLLGAGLRYGSCAAHPILDEGPFVHSRTKDHPEASTRYVEYRALDVVDRMAVALQAALLVQHAPSDVADAICQSRLGQSGQHNYGSLPSDVKAAAIIERATPHCDGIAV